MASPEYVWPHMDKLADALGAECDPTLQKLAMPLVF